MKKALKFLLVLSVFAAFLIGASTMAMAENPNEKKVTIGDSEITITSDKGFMVPLPGNTNAGVDVTFQITSKNSPITEVSVWDDYEYYNSNSVTYTHEYNYMDVESNVMKITLKDGSSAELLYCPIILPASFLSGDISLKTDPTGLAIKASGYKVKNGPEYWIEVYKGAARTKSQFIAAYPAKTEGGPVSILKKNNSWYKPNTKYYLSIYPVNYYMINGKETMLKGNPTKRTIQTSPTVNPVIKSVKISNVKVKAYRPNPLSTVVRYKTTYKMTITLSKKASNIKGIKVKAGLGEYTAKGTGKVFTINCVNDSGVSYKGTKQKMKVMTYSASASYGYALSGQTKYKTYTIKNGTY